MAKALSRKVTIYINGKEVESTIKSLTAELNKLKNQQKGMVLGSEEYIKASLKIKEIEGVLAEQKAAVRGIGEEWKATRTKLADYSNMLMGAQSAFQMIDFGVGSLKELAKDAAALDDIYADVQKTTGLTHEQVEKLNEAFKKMDTRTSREQLNQLAYEAGKLGISSEEAIKQFVSASDKINIALGDVLGDGAMVTVGKLTNIYEGVSSTLEGKNLEEKMLAIGSAVNSLGQASTANEGYMVEFMKRLGGIASQAKLSADQVLGYASALDQNGQAVEMSATAFMKLIQQMVKKPQEFVQAAGVSMAEFKQMMDTDMNGAIMRVLEGMERGGGFQQLIGMFADMGLDGARAATVVSSLAKHLDQVREAQALANREMQTGSSVINEFNTKNETMQAQAEKARKKFEDMRIELGNELYPVLIHLQRSGTVLMKQFAALVGVVKSNKAVIPAFTAALIALNFAKLKNFATDKAKAAYSKIQHGIEKISVDTTKQHTAAQDLNTLASLRLQKARIALASSNKTVKYTIDGMSVASDKLTAKRNIDIAITRQQTAAQKSLGAAMKATPWGVVIAAVATLIPLFVSLRHNSEGWKVGNAFKEAGKQAGEAEGKVRVLYERMKAAGEGTDIYRKALEQLKAEYPDIIAKHIDEEGNLRNLEKAYKDLSVAARQSAFDRMYEEKVAEAYGNEAEKLSKIIVRMQKNIRAKKGVPEIVQDEVFQMINGKIEEMRQGKLEMEEAGKQIFQILKEHDMYALAGGTSEFDTRDTFTAFVDEYLKPIVKATEDTERIINRFKTKLNPTKEDEQITYTTLENAQKRKAAIESEIEVLKQRMSLFVVSLQHQQRDKALYAQMESQLYDLEAAARGVANEIIGIEKTLSGLSVEQMKARKTAIRQEILSLQAKLNVMESLAYVDFVAKKNVEDDRAKIEQLNREWLQLEQAIKKAQDEAAKASDTQPFSADKETLAQRRAREKREREEKAWESFSGRYEQTMAKVTARTLTGIDKINAEVDASLMKMKQDLESIDKTQHPQAAAMLEEMTQKAEEWKRAKIDEYISKTAAEIDKLRKSTAKQGNGEMVDKAAKAVEELRQGIKAIDTELVKLYGSQAALFSKTDEDSVLQLHKINEQIETYKQLRSAKISAAFAEIGTTVKNPFEKELDKQEDRTNYSFSRARQKAIEEVSARIEEYRKKLDDAIEAERMMMAASLEYGNTDEADVHRENIRLLKEKKKQLDKVAEGEKNIKEQAEKLAKSKAFEKTLMNWADAIDEFGDKALSVFSNINTLLKNIADSRLQELEDEKDAEIESLDEQLEQGLISQETYEAKKAEIEKTYNDKEKEEALNEWRRDKALRIAEANIASAVAVMKIWAGEGETWYKVAMSAMMAAEFATKIAAIRNEPEPYAKGGYVTRRTVYQAGEAGPEWVASNSLLNDPATAPIIEQLEAYQRGNRRAIADIPMAQLNMPVATRAARELGRRRSLSENRLSETLPPINPNVSVSMPQNEEMMQLWRELAEYLKDPNNRRAVISRQTMTDFDNNENFLRSRARL